MNVREIFESDDRKMKTSYAYIIGKFAYHRMYTKNETPEDHAIKKICDIYFYAPEMISIKQLDWVIRYATKFRIEYPITSTQSAVSSTNSAIEEIKI